MNDREQELDALDRWLLEVREGTATERETAEWNARLLADPVMQAEYVRRMLLEASLVEELQTLEAESTFHPLAMLPPAEAAAPTPAVVAPSRFTTNLRTLSLVAAASLLVAWIAFDWMWPSGPQTAPLAPPIAASDDAAEDGGTAKLLDVDGFAILTKAVGVEWVAGSSPLQVNDRIAARRLKIAAGVLQLEFFNGPTVVIEGPAEFEIVSDMRCICHYGKLRADVPPHAIGFTIGGGEFDVVDLGTEFAMRVTERGAGEVHVLQGEVSLRRSGVDGERRVKLGEAVQFSTAGELDGLAVDRHGFVDPASLLELERTSQAAGYAQWREQSRRWANDPDILLYYDFEGHRAADRRLRSAIADASSPDAAIVGCRWAEGRFAGKGALEFKRTSDRARVTIPGTFTSLSFVVWLRVEGLDQWYNSLLLTDEYLPGQVHWQLTSSADLRISVAGADQGKQFALNSGTILQPQDLGRWVQLATVLDGVAHRVRHYRDGRLVREAEFHSTAELRLGAAEIGNWNPQRPGKDAIRSLNGLVDEIAVFRRPLSVAEIEAAYQAGVPYR